MQFRNGLKQGVKLDGITVVSIPKDDASVIYIIVIENFNNDNDIETLIIRRKDLLERLCDQNYGDDNQINLRFWLTSDNPVKSGRRVYETFGIGMVFEFIGLFISTNHDYSKHLRKLSIFNC